MAESAGRLSADWRAFQRTLRGVGVRKAYAAGVAAVREEAERVMTISKRLVPVRHGILRASGHVTVLEQRGLIIGRLGYGGAASRYALPVHEIPPPPAKSVGGRSARHRAPTGWKYLERPVRAAERGLEGRLGRRLQDILESWKAST